MYSPLLQHCTTEIEGNPKGMDTCDSIETVQDRIELAKIICSICHIQYYDKRYVMVMVETNKQLYLFYQRPCQ